MAKTLDFHSSEEGSIPSIGTNLVDIDIDKLLAKELRPKGVHFNLSERLNQLSKKGA